MNKATKQKIRMLVSKYLDELGATRHWPIREDLLGVNLPEYTLNTKAGLLNISVYGDWIATCFADDKAARKLLPEINKYTGKWNFHFHDSISAEKAVENFTSNLERVLLPASSIQGAKSPLTQKALAKEYLELTAKEAKRLKADKATHAALAIMKLREHRSEDGLSHLDYAAIIREAVWNEA